MTIKGKYFPSQASGERVFLLIRRHWLIFFAIFLFIFILLVPVVILTIYWLANPDTFSGPLGNFVLIFGSMYTLAVIGLSLYGFVNYYLDVYIVTNKRIVNIKQNGFFRREIAELHLHQVQDVEARVEGFFQTLVHYGNIHIQTAGERENFLLEDVPHPYTLAKEIVQLHEAQIEAEYEPKAQPIVEEVDDYRPEDFFPSDSAKVSNSKFQHQQPAESEKQPVSDSEIAGGIKYLDDNPTQESGEESVVKPSGTDDTAGFENQKPLEEFGFGANKSENQKNFEQELKEMSEGEEVSLDNKN